MLDRAAFKRQARRTAVLTVALLAALVFGVLVLARGDWLPGTIIVVASLISLGRQVPVISRLCAWQPPSASTGGAARR